MFDVKHLELTELEVKALWLRADLVGHIPCPEIDRDDALRAAGVSAIGKIYRLYRGMDRPSEPQTNAALTTQ